MCKHTSSATRGSEKPVERHRPQSVPQPPLENSSMTLPKMSGHAKENVTNTEIPSGASSLLLPSCSNSDCIVNCSNDVMDNRAGGQELKCASTLVVKDTANALLHSWPASAFPSDENNILNKTDSFCDASCSKGTKSPLWAIIEDKNRNDFYSSDEYQRRISASTPDIPCGSEESLLPSSETATPCHGKDGIASKLCSDDPSPVLLSAHKESDIDLIRFSPSGFSDCMDTDNDNFEPSKDVSSRISSCVFHCDGEEGLSDDDGNNLTDDFDSLVINNYNLTPVIMISHENDLRQSTGPGCDESTDLFLDTFFQKRFGLPQVKSAAEISVTSSISQKSLPICRICHLPASEDDGLISPCRCAGTMQFIHNGCLLKWLEICSKRSKRPPSCELCLYQYHRHKKFRIKHWEFPQCSRRDKILHIIFIVSVAMMISCATATILCFKQDKGVRSSVDKTELTKSEVITLVCGVLFFIAFFVAMYVEVKSRNTLYKLMTSFLYLNQQWYIDEYDKKKDVQPVPV